MELLNRKDLVNKLAEQEDISKAKTNRIIFGFLEGIKEQIIAGNRFKIAGFGSFYKKTHKARKARNLTTNQEVLIPEREMPHWKASNEIKNAILAPQTTVEATK